VGIERRTLNPPQAGTRENHQEAQARNGRE
jgi:hypothetical protein